ncbi:MAG: flavodoxin [Acidimicrobiales bacterium]|nr:flavodoxin [Acidimicrobiales bacterium]
MPALVVFESRYANTHAVAAAIADGLRSQLSVDVAPVADAPWERVAAAELLVVGGPTHAHVPWTGTRRAVLTDERHRRDPDPAADAGSLRDWLGSLGRVAGTATATFDTRFRKPLLLTGSAAHGTARRLRRRGFVLLDEPASFFVGDVAGPLLSGEAHRAMVWGRALADRHVRIRFAA